MLNEKLNYIIIIYFIPFFLLIASPPIFSLLWSLVPTAYFSYNCNYKDILKIWGFIFGIWYLIFTIVKPGFHLLAKLSIVLLRRVQSLKKKFIIKIINKKKI